MNQTRTIKHRVVRVVKQGDDITLETEVWSGTSINGLSRLYPPSDVFGADPLGYSELEDGLISTSHRFERQLEDGTWEKITDPRRRLNPTMTVTERAIDADNRRDFPGDYVTGYSCERCADEGCEWCEVILCTNCDDHGCQLCDPDPTPDCIACDDFGCQKCDPYCIACNSRGVSQDGDLCSECEKWTTGPHCIACTTRATPLVGAAELHNSICMDCADFYGIYDECWILFATNMLGIEYP